MDTVTTEMHPELKAELVRLGWEKRIESLPWGRLVKTNKSTLCMEWEGKHYWYVGPVVTVRGGDQIAVVRNG